nr:MarR family transcriptional regulator [Streptomyces sp. NK08204]
MHTSTVSRQMAALERAGLIGRRPDPDNRRVHVSHLTGAGGGPGAVRRLPGAVRHRGGPAAVRLTRILAGTRGLRRERGALDGYERGVDRSRA